MPGVQGFADTIFGLFGQQPQREEAFQEGQLMGARTESALAQARERRSAALDAERQNTERARLQKLRDEAGTGGADTSIMDQVLAGYNPEQYTGAKLDQQEFGFRDTLADPAADPLARFGAGQGVQGEVMPRYYQPAAGMIADNTNPNAEPSVTPVGQAQIDNYGELPAAGGAGAAAKIPMGYRMAQDGVSFEPVPGGPADPNKPAVIGAREAVYLNRVLGSATQGIASVKNITRLPVGASSGILGVGASPGKSIFESAKGALLNKIADQDVQTYNRMIAGLTRNLATIEGQGLVPAGSFVNSFDSLALRPGDTELTKLQSLAEMRQTIEAGLAPISENPRIPPQTKQFVDQLLGQIREAVPFNWENLLDFQAQDDPQATIMDLARSRGLAPPATPGAAPAASGAQPLRRLSKSGKPIVSMDGGATWEYE
jgi:hypothetical protein